MIRAIEIIKEIKQTHQEWMDYFEKNPDLQSLKEYKHVGDINHHRKCIEEYNVVIAEIEQLQEENRRQAERIKELERDKIHET